MKKKLPFQKQICLIQLSLLFISSLDEIYDIKLQSIKQQNRLCPLLVKFKQ